MPIREYKCQNCRAISEAIIPNPPPKRDICSECGGMAHLVISLPVDTGWRYPNVKKSYLDAK